MLFTIISDRCAPKIAAKLPSRMHWTRHSIDMTNSSWKPNPSKLRSFAYPQYLRGNGSNVMYSSATKGCHSPHGHTLATRTTYTKKSSRNNCDMATTLPIKNPTAKELWNFRIIIVPPTDKIMSMIPDHIAAKPSEAFRVEVTSKLKMSKMPDNIKIAYLKSCIMRAWRNENNSAMPM